MSTRLVPLLNGGYAIVDEQDYELIAALNWSVHNDRGNIYAMNRANYDCTYMHRVIMGNPSRQIDHRDRNGLNNSRSNLRMATHSQNQANAKIPVTNKSGFKGVFGRGGKWVASIRIDGRTQWLGTFTNKMDAVAVRKQKAIEIHGDFANG